MSDQNEALDAEKRALYAQFPYLPLVEAATENVKLTAYVAFMLKHPRPWKVADDYGGMFSSPECLWDANGKMIDLSELAEAMNVEVGPHVYGTTDGVTVVRIPEELT